MNLDQSFSILFWLNKCKANSKGVAPIYVRITVDGKRAECSTSKTIKPEYWNSDKGLPTDEYHLAKPLAQYLRQTETEIEKHYNILLTAREYVSADDVKRSFRGVKEQHKTLIELLTQFAKKLEERVEQADLSAGCYEHFLTLSLKCSYFIRHQFDLKDIFLKDLKLGFIEEFYHFLRTTTLTGARRVEKRIQVRKGCAAVEQVIYHSPIGQNTAMKYCKQLKQVMDYAAKFEYLSANPFRYFKCTYLKPKRTYLNEDELDLIYTKRMPVARLEEVKDCYLFCCYTGYAYGDAVELTPNDIAFGIDGKKWIIRDRNKTDNTENVPLLPVALEIIEKYKDHPYCIQSGRLLPMNSNQRYNGYLKEVADVVGIRKRLTTHTARHTFATTVTLNNGVPIETVGKLLGHEDIRTTQIYAKIVDQKVSQDMNALTEKLQSKKQTAKKATVTAGKGQLVA